MTLLNLLDVLDESAAKVRNSVLAAYAARDSATDN